MDKQIIISIGREFGSGGHEIGRKIAKLLDIPFYDRNLLDEIADAKNVDAKKLEKYDEAPSRMFLSRTVRGFSNSPSVNVAEMQFDLLREKAAAGESFVIVGRCSEDLFKEVKGLFSVFILGDYETKLDRVMERRSLSAKEAALAIERHDRNRKAYHNHFCNGKWGDSRNYDMCINSSRLGVDGTVEYLKDYVDRFIKTL